MIAVFSFDGKALGEKLTKKNLPVLGGFLVRLHLTPCGLTSGPPNSEHPVYHDGESNNKGERVQTAVHDPLTFFAKRYRILMLTIHRHKGQCQ